MRPNLQQLRVDFIENFARIPWNSTPGDAQFLRILIESSKAKSGLEVGVATGYGAIVMGLGFERTAGDWSASIPTPRWSRQLGRTSARCGCRTWSPWSREKA